MVNDVDALLGKLDAHPNSLIFARLANTYLKSGRTDQAIHICEEGLSHRYGYLSGHVIMAKCYAKIGLVDQAKEEYHRTLKFDAGHIGALFHLGELSYGEKKYDHALTYFEQILFHDPLNKVAHKLIDELRDINSNTPEPCGHLENSKIEGDSSDKIATLTLAEIYATQGLSERAIQVLRHILEHHPDKTGILDRIRTLEQECQTVQDGGENGHNG
jgi:Tfp pilus assembly protein PilF